jgi:integrase
LNLGEVQRFFALPWRDPRYYAINRVAAMTGMRLGEIRGLQAEDLTEKVERYTDAAGTERQRVTFEIHVCHNWQDTEPDGRKMKGPKHSTLVNVKARDVPISPLLIAMLRELAARNPWQDGFVIWGDSRGKPLSESIILRHYEEQLQKIGIAPEERKRRKLSLHAWRHWYRSELDAAGLSARAGDEITGHAEGSVGHIYTHVTAEQRSVAVKIEAGLLEDQATPDR